MRRFFEHHFIPCALVVLLLGVLNLFTGWPFGIPLTATHAPSQILLVMEYQGNALHIVESFDKQEYVDAVALRDAVPGRQIRAIQGTILP